MAKWYQYRIICVEPFLIKNSILRLNIYLHHSHLPDIFSLVFISHCTASLAQSSLMSFSKRHKGDHTYRSELLNRHCLLGKCVQNICFPNDTINEPYYKEKERKTDDQGLEIQCLCNRILYSNDLPTLLRTLLKALMPEAPSEPGTFSLLHYTSSKQYKTPKNSKKDSDICRKKGVSVVCWTPSNFLCGGRRLLFKYQITGKDG